MATQEERKAETRALLLDAAADLFARKGVHAVSVDAIADAAGRTSGALYAHFGGKEGLLVELVDHRSRRAAARISADVSEDDGIEERLTAIWHGWAAPSTDRHGRGHPDGGHPDGGHARDLAPTDGDEEAAWSQLEHELWLEATRRPELAERVAARFAAARATTGAGLLAWWSGQAGAQDASPAGSEGAAHTADVGTLTLALLYGLEMQRRIEPSAVPDDLAVRGLLALLEA